MPGRRQRWGLTGRIKVYHEARAFIENKRYPAKRGETPVWLLETPFPFTKTIRFSFVMNRV